MNAVQQKMPPAELPAGLNEPRPKRKKLAISLTLGAVVLAALAIKFVNFGSLHLYLPFLKGARNHCIETLIALGKSRGGSWLAEPIHKLFRDVILSPIFYLSLALFFLLERFLPAQRSAKVFSSQLRQDLIWLVVQQSLFLTLTAWYVGFLESFYAKHFSFLTLPWGPHWSFGARLAVAILAVDFVSWAQHLLRHKVTALWFLHTVHHSQRELNPFTDSRYHMAEYIVLESIRFVPMLMLGIHADAIVGFAVFSAFYSRLYHSNIRSNFGFLRYFMVTPQSHRVHHSFLPEHKDRNFGLVFCVWDRLFGTQSADDQTYPETGIIEAEFPYGSFLQQQFYPLTLFWKRWGRLCAADALEVGQNSLGLPRASRRSINLSRREARITRGQLDVNRRKLDRLSGTS